MAPERPGAGPGRAHAPRELPRNHQAEVGSWPLPARVVRQIQRQVALAGRSLQRLEVRGAIIDNFDALGPPSPPSPQSPNYYDCGETYEEESMGEGTTSGVMGPTEDNDLTSLTWLQDRNLLRSINLSKNENDEMKPISVQISPQQSAVSGASPTSDYLEESFTSEPADSSGSDQGPPASPPRSHAIPQRHNGFHEIPKTNGSVSKLKHPQNIAYNPLVHTQNKPPYSFSCLIFMAIEDSAAKALPVKEIYSWIVAHFPYFRSAPTGWKNSVRHNLSLNKCFQKVEKAPSLGKGSLWMVDNQYRSNLLQAFSRSPFHPCLPPSPSPEPNNEPAPTPTPPSHQAQAPTPTPAHNNHNYSQDRVPSVPESNGTKGAPNPQLFPFLSKRLAASTRRPPPEPPAETPSLDSYDSGDEVLAAAMVLALKHGPGVMSLPLPLISSCATQDHTYSFSTGSPEAGYGSDAEQRITAEVLLHLASSPPAPHTQVTNQVSHRPRLLRRAPKRISPSSPPPNQQPVSLSPHASLATQNNNNNNTNLNKNMAGHSSQSRAKRPRPHII